MLRTVNIFRAPPIADSADMCGIHVILNRIAICLVTYIIYFAKNCVIHKIDYYRLLKTLFSGRSTDPIIQSLKGAKYDA